jgi:hypothetical protein
MTDPRRYGYKRLETDEELRERCLLKRGDRKDQYAIEVLTAKAEALDKLAWELFLQRKIIDVY